MREAKIEPKPSSSAHSAPGSAVQVVPSNTKDKKRQFTRELRLMMYGFGDVPNPLQQSVELMEDLTISYISSLCQKTITNSQHTGHGKITIEDFLFALRGDSVKLNRAEELLFRFDELLKARKAFETKMEDY